MSQEIRIQSVAHLYRLLLKELGSKTNFPNEKARQFLVNKVRTEFHSGVAAAGVASENANSATAMRHQLTQQLALMRAVNVLQVATISEDDVENT